MARRLRPLRVLLPAGVLSGCVVASRSSSSCEEKHEGSETETFPTKFVSQLEAWLMPTSEDSESLGLMVKELRDAVSEDIQITAEESKRLPLNFLMVKAMHDRQLLTTTRTGKKRTARNRGRAGLSPRDRKVLQRSAHFARFAAASYDGVVDTVKDLVAEGEVSRPPNLLYQSADDVRKWCVSKRTRIDPDDVKEITISDSLQTQTYFVAVDHVSRSVVVSIRGTYSFTDTMVDLLCDPVDFAGGKAHNGISQSALRVWRGVQEQVEKQLKEHSDYKLVLTGHSLGAGTAILLKILLERNAKEALKGSTKSSEDGKTKVELAPAKLNVGRSVRVECYAFAPPPVFSAPIGAPWAQYVYSFVNGADCVPTMSLGSVYALCRTIQNVDKLPLDIYKRAEFILDARVRVQQSEQGRKAEDGERYRSKVAHDILQLRNLPFPTFGGDGVYEGDNYDGDLEPAEGDLGDIWAGGGEEEEEEAGQQWQVMTSEVETDGNVETDDNGEETNSSTISAIEEEVWSTISKFEGDWAKFTEDVSEATESLLDAVNKASSSAGSFCDSVGRVMDSVFGMTSDEVALTALLLKQLAVGGGPSPDDVLPMVKKCERQGYRPDKGLFRSYKTMTVGDLIIPGNVYLIEGWKTEDGAQEGGSKGGRGRGRNAVSVRKTSSAELGGVRLNNSMMADHSVDAYESAIAAAAQRYRKRG
ncbi:unnamed protein product [Pylaiella littoralis]